MVEEEEIAAEDEAEAVEDEDGAIIIPEEEFQTSNRKLETILLRYTETSVPLNVKKLIV